MKTSNTFKLLLVLVIVLISGYLTRLFWKSASNNRPNVLIILVDTLRADHLGIYGYERDTSPNIDNFARQNLLYLNAYSSSAWTPPSVASIFTGVYPSVHGHMPRPGGSKFGRLFTRIDEKFKTLAESFREINYTTAAITANPLIGEKYGLTQGFEQFYSPGREKGDIITRRAIKYLSKLRPKDRPFFLYLHYLDPHDPYQPPNKYKNLFTGQLTRPYQESELKIISQYDGEIKFIDDQIGTLFNWLKTNNLYEDLSIIFVSDHGEQFRERGFLGHGDRVHSEEIHIPLIIKANGRSGQISEVASLVDIYPTLLDLLKITPDLNLQGLSLLGDLSLRKKDGVFTEIARHYNLKAYTTTSGERLIYEFPMENGLNIRNLSNPISLKLFNLKNDPFELNPIDIDIGSENGITHDSTSLYEKITELSKDYDKVELPEDPEMLEELKTLGYL